MKTDVHDLRNTKELHHAKLIVKKLEKLQMKRPLTNKEIQEKYYWQSRVLTPEDEFNAIIDGRIKIYQGYSWKYQL